MYFSVWHKTATSNHILVCNMACLQETAFKWQHFTDFLKHKLFKVNVFTNVICSQSIIVNAMKDILDDCVYKKDNHK